MSIAALVQEMVEAGATPQVIAIAVRAVEAERAKLEARRTSDRDRQRVRRSRDGHVTNADVSRDSHGTGSPPSPPIDNNKTLTPSPPTPHKGSARATPREILLECLSPEIADGVLAHRKAMRRPLTGRAAQLLAKGFLATADPNAAADMMIERGWQGFKPEWFDNERRSNGQPQQQSGKKRSISDVAPGFIERIDKLYADRGSRPSDGGAAGGEAVRLLSSQRRE